MKRLVYILCLALTTLLCPLRIQAQTAAEDSLYAVYLLTVVAPQPDVAHYVSAFAHLLEGTPYVGGTLDRDTTERLVVDLRRLDCTTFVETVLALARTAAEGKRSFERFKEHLTSLRYRDALLDGYASRLHYFSDWIADNERRGNVTEISSRTRHTPDTLQLHFMSRHAEHYPHLRDNSALTAEIAAHERRLSNRIIGYLPQENLDKTSLTDVQEGDIIAFTTGTPGLDIAHVGIATMREGEVHVIHASSTGRCVIIEKRTIEQQVKDNKRFTGIRIVRPCPPEKRK